MSSLLRQLVAVLVVMIITAGLGISTAKAAMALECELTLATSVSEAPTLASHAEHSHDHGGTGSPVAGHQHDGQDTASGDADASHCKAHACPSTAMPAFNAVMPAADVGQTLAVISSGSLVELTVPEGLRRPPRG